MTAPTKLPAFDANLADLLRRAKAHVEAMSPEELEAMLRMQRASWVRGEMGMRENEQRRTGRAIPPAQSDADLLEALQIAVAHMGWRGSADDLPADTYQCEFCAARHADSDLIEHTADCIVTMLRVAITKATGAKP